MLTELTRESIQQEIDALKVVLLDPNLDEATFLETNRKINRVSSMISIIETEERLHKLTQ